MPPAAKRFALALAGGAVSVLVIFLVATRTSMLRPASGTEITEYQKVKIFEKDLPIRYPDFTIVFRGSHETGDRIRFTYQDFTVIDGSGKTQEVSWSSGTGDISPVFFSVGNKKFGIELSSSMVVEKPLPPNSFVISPDGVYEMILHNENERTAVDMSRVIAHDQARSTFGVASEASLIVAAVQKLGEWSYKVTWVPAVNQRGGSVAVTVDIGKKEITDVVLGQ